jgi:hypothetical protein
MSFACGKPNPSLQKEKLLFRLNFPMSQDNAPVTHHRETLRDWKSSLDDAMCKSKANPLGTSWKIQPGS